MEDEVKIRALNGHTSRTYFKIKGLGQCAGRAHFNAKCAGMSVYPGHGT